MGSLTWEQKAVYSLKFSATKQRQIPQLTTELGSFNFCGASKISLEMSYVKPISTHSGYNGVYSKDKVL